MKLRVCCSMSLLYYFTCRVSDVHLTIFLLKPWWSNLYRIRRMTTSTIQSFSHWRRRWQKENHRKFPLLCQYLNHILLNTTYVLFLILGCNRRLCTLYLSRIWHFQRFTLFFNKFEYIQIFWFLLGIFLLPVLLLI